jgi:hypothetical protein
MDASQEEVSAQPRPYALPQDQASAADPAIVPDETLCGASRPLHFGHQRIIAGVGDRALA